MNRVLHRRGERVGANISDLRVEPEGSALPALRYLDRPRRAIVADGFAGRRHDRCTIGADLQARIDSARPPPCEEPSLHDRTAALSRGRLRSEVLLPGEQHPSTASYPVASAPITTLRSGLEASVRRS